MFFNSYADPAGLPPMNSPSLLSLYPPYELSDPEVYASLSPNANKFFEHSTTNFPFELPLPDGHEFTTYPFMNPGPNLNEFQDLGFTEIGFNHQSEVQPYADPQSLFSTPPRYGQSSSISPRLSTSSLEFAPAFSQESSPNFSASDITPSFLFPQQSLEQLPQATNEYLYLEPENTMPILNLQTAPNYCFSNIAEGSALHQNQPDWRPTQQATSSPESKAKRKATTSKRTSASTSLSNPYPLATSSSSKFAQPPRGKRSTRSSHLILTDSPVSVTQGGYARKYACTWEGCGKAFTTSGHLVRHKRIHTGEKRYECAMENCSSRFSRQDNMLQHL
ncbi:uncharacterized protein VP01_1599g4 [Puccinia sorghi]|uniref:C2H2-type domain-containing protein n=1 Tax=Puccinia sorghi TaxID=27349 RepID=A0A0L6VJ84_9BASI|nr:uncharacterized protein VP01_1599g4 [Puccinia sorghi]